MALKSKIKSLTGFDVGHDWALQDIRLASGAILQLLGTSPAAVNRRTGVCELHPQRFFNLAPEHRLFVLLHEDGHIKHNTRNELTADAHAFEIYASLGFPLSKSVYALADILSNDNAAHRMRTENILASAQQFDQYYLSLGMQDTHNLTATQRRNQALDKLYSELDRQIDAGNIESAGEVCNVILEFAPAATKSALRDKLNALLHEGLRQEGAAINFIGGAEAVAEDINRGQMACANGEEFEYFGKKKKEAKLEDIAKELNIDLTTKEGREAAKKELRRRNTEKVGGFLQTVGRALGLLGGEVQSRSQKAAPTDDSTPTDTKEANTTPEPKKGLPVWAWVLIGLAALGLIGGGIWLAVRKKT